MAAKHADRTRDKRTERRDHVVHEDSYLSDWQRKSRQEIVQDAIAGLNQDLREVTRKKVAAG